MSEIKPAVVRHTPCYCEHCKALGLREEKAIIEIQALRTTNAEQARRIAELEGEIKRIESFREHRAELKLIQSRLALATAVAEAASKGHLVQEGTGCALCDALAEWRKGER